MPACRQLPISLQLGEILRYGGAVLLNPLLWLPALSISAAILYSEPEPVPLWLPPALWAGYGLTFLLWFVIIWRVVNPAYRRQLAGRPGSKPETRSANCPPVAASPY